MSFKITDGTLPHDENGRDFEAPFRAPWGEQFTLLVSIGKIESPENPDQFKTFADSLTYWEGYRDDDGNEYWGGEMNQNGNLNEVESAAEDFGAMIIDALDHFFTIAPATTAPEHLIGFTTDDVKAMRPDHDFTDDELTDIVRSCDRTDWSFVTDSIEEVVGSVIDDKIS